MKTDVDLLTLTPEATLHQITERSNKVPGLLKSIGLNPEQYADKTLRQVCTEKQWSETELLNWIKHHKSGLQQQEPASATTGSQIAQDAPLPDICKFIEEETLQPIRSATGPIHSRFKRVNKVHGIQYPWLKTIAWDLEQLLNKLEDVVRFEQETFYPLAGDLQQQRDNLIDGDVQKIKRSMKIVKEDHHQIAKRMNQIRKAGNYFRFDESACPTLRILCNQLTDLFDEVERHITLENEKLLPALENRLAE